MADITTAELASLEYIIEDQHVTIRCFQGKSSITEKCLAELEVKFVDLSFYAKQHLLKKPPLFDCGIVVKNGVVDTFMMPTGRTRMAGNGSIAQKYYDITSPIEEEEVEPYERVAIRLPSGVFAYVFFKAQYLTQAEDPRRGALFLIDPTKIVTQYAMTRDQQKEFQSFGGKKVLYFDVLGAPNLQERKQEIQRCRERGYEKMKKYEEADKQWEEEMSERISRKVQEETEKPKLSKKAKQKARQAAKTAREDEDATVGDAEEERLHKLRQAESRARVEEELRLERELESQKKKLEAAEVKRLADEDAARMNRVKALLQKVQSSMDRSAEAQACEK